MEGEILHPFDSVTQSVLFSVVDLGVLIEELLQYLLHLGRRFVLECAQSRKRCFAAYAIIIRKNSVILKVCIRRPISGIPAINLVSSCSCLPWWLAHR